MHWGERRHLGGNLLPASLHGAQASGALGFLEVISCPPGSPHGLQQQSQPTLVLSGKGWTLWHILRRSWCICGIRYVCYFPEYLQDDFLRYELVTTAPVKKILASWSVSTAMTRPGLGVFPFSHLKRGQEERARRMILWYQKRDIVMSNWGRSLSVMTPGSPYAPPSAHRPPLATAQWCNGAGMFLILNAP